LLGVSTIIFSPAWSSFSAACFFLIGFLLLRVLRKFRRLPPRVSLPTIPPILWAQAEIASETTAGRCEDFHFDPAFSPVSNLEGASQRIARLLAQTLLANG
jgi:hypothetical protein